MADDGGRMKGVAGSGEDQGEEKDDEAREEELELALSLGRPGWHPPPAPPPTPALGWALVFPAWDPDEAGSSQAAGRVWGGSPPVPPLRFGDMWRGGSADGGGDAGGTADGGEEHNGDEEDEGSDDGERDLHNKRPKVRGYG